MGLIDFVRSAGEKLFGNKEKEKADKEAALVRFVNKLGLPVQGLKIDLNEEIATVYGAVESQETARRSSSRSATRPASRESTIASPLPHRRRKPRRKSNCKLCITRWSRATH